MLSFHDFYELVEQDLGGPPGGGMPPGDMGGGMPPGGMGGPPSPMGGMGGPPGGPMGGPPPGGAPGGAAPTTELKPADVWTVLEKILAGKPVEEKKPSGQKEEGDVESMPQPSQPPELPPTGMPGMPPAPAPGVAGQPPQPLLGAPPM